MNPQCEVDFCRLCGFVFLDKRRKRNIVGEFAVVGVEILEGDNRAVVTQGGEILEEWEDYPGAAAKKKTPNFHAEFK